MAPRAPQAREAALINVIADCYPPRRLHPPDGQTRQESRHRWPVGAPGVPDGPDLDENVAQFRHRSLGEAGPFTFVAANALTMKAREGGRVINSVVLVAAGVNGDGHREVLGLQVATSETRSAWSTFFADLVARGLTGVQLVTSDAHAGLGDAIAANPARSDLTALPHPLRSQPDVCDPKSMWPAVKAMFQSVYDQPDAASEKAPVRTTPGLHQREAAGRRRAPRAGTGRRAGVHHVP